MTAQREPSEHAGKTVKVRDGIPFLGGMELQVKDWWINEHGLSWKDCLHNPAVTIYAARAQEAKLPDDGDVLYGWAGPFGHLVHVSEIEVPA